MASCFRVPPEQPAGSRGASSDGSVAGPAAVPARLRQALAATTRVRGDLPAVLGQEVHDAICEYVGQLRRQGLPPERALIAVKRALDDAGVSRRYGSPHEAFTERVVRWCIEEYYREPEAERGRS